MKAGCLAMLAALAVAVPAAAHAQQGHMASVYAGYRFGGELTDAATGDAWQMTEGAAYAVSVALDIDRRSQYELYVSRRSGELALRASSFSPAVSRIGLDITYIQFGGTYFYEEIGRGLYLLGGVGLTNLDPRESGLDAETNFSLNVGVGYMIPLAGRVALKLEGRAFATLVSSSSALFCSGGCVVQIQGDTFGQGEVSAGLAVRF
ncbi:MAG: outer membrane beta-barrel protein [Betaproteobacteria bacterium]|nr:outer membrane beta-barrel protein [Betaproteobacteria bacterium]MDH5221859.1 outer membrane beta-barrel protein [Betaproteobacteria bacterium]MDH5350969.1 outer membrane beta-barrel protein [Betaproteobacteria bacterium]